MKRDNTDLPKLYCKRCGLEIEYDITHECNGVKSAHSSVIERILRKTPLSTRIFILLQMNDYDNWIDGEYLGDNDKLIELTKMILEDVYEWVDEGSPGLGNLDLSRYKDSRKNIKIKKGYNK